MNLRSPRFFIFLLILVVLIVGSLSFLILRRSNTQNQSASETALTYATVYPQNAPPTPGAARTTYTNLKYGYIFLYPSEWRLKIYTFQNVETVQGQYQVHAGVDGYPFNVDCQANPNGQDEQSWFKQNGHGTGIGLIQLKSGVTAYLAVAHGQEGYIIYTLAHKYTICQFAVTIANQANNDITDSVVNSFKWL